MVVDVPVDAGKGVRTAREISMWEQLIFAAFLQRYWADNQARSVPHDPSPLAKVLDVIQSYSLQQC